MWDIRGRSGSINSRTDEGGAAAARDSEKPTTVASMDIENGTGGDEGDRVPLAPDSSSSSANPAIRSSSGDASQSRGIQNNDKTANSKLIQVLAFVTLIGIHVAFVLLLRTSKRNSGARYINSTAVALMECLKVIGSLSMLLASNGFVKGLRVAYRGVLKSWGGIIKLSVPSFLYVVQNNLLYVALDNLDAVVYLLCRQTKILTTAVMSVLLLKKSVMPLQWVSLLLLMVGIATVQLSKTNPSKGSDPDNPTVGILAVFGSTIISGYAGVYFERVLKKDTGGEKAPSHYGEDGLWVRNIQMSVSSIPIAFATMLIQDGATVRDKGFFYGYTGIVAGVVVLQASQGLMNAVVVNFLDNIIRGFASSYCIIVTLLFEIWLFDFRPNIQFLGGTVMVITASVMYAKFKAKRKKHTGASAAKKRDSAVAPVELAADADALADGNTNGHAEDDDDENSSEIVAADIKRPLL